MAPGRVSGSADYKATTAARETIIAAMAGTSAEKLAEFVTPKLPRTALTAEQERRPVKVTLPIDGTLEQRAANGRNVCKLPE